MSLTPITFSNDQISFLSPSWEEMNELSFQISKHILEDGRKIDRIVTLAKGGWPYTRSLVDFLGVKEVASIGVKFYKGVNTRLDKPEIYQELPVSVVGENILLFDDVADTGESLLFVKDYLHSLGVEGIITASLFYKPHSKIKPDYYGCQTSSWIVFPYEVRESVRILANRWLQEQIPQSGIIDRFEKLGFQRHWIEYYLLSQ